ncbi:RagB/SusD family nutrient uptake outer membrane protein [Desertivirga arenae]|uniref:RagB/SusD family nutrient uptake outer membrane protein n=1 Tax=Desertivirga arenae TaxID=2810309 RepID=UPI001F620ACB|nr:RagB/SusD family nutrient uptake outer membrane protein [Pedobacter sp. SYSU D00823]
MLPDRGGIDAAIWSTEGALDMHLNRAYDVIMPMFLYENFNTNNMNGRYGVHYASDENCFPVGDEMARKALGLQVPPLNNNDVRFAGNVYTVNAGNNKYMDISRCNNAIKFIPEGTLLQATKDRFLGQYYALRAMVYFDLVKVYGGVPLVLEPQDPENVTAQGRASAKECFKVIVSDLDSAMSKLKNVTWDDGTGRGRLDRLAAACLKAKALLYWASPQFNPQNDQSRWATALEANKAAYQMALDGQKRLVTKYEDIFRVEPNSEAIIVRPYSETIDRRGQDAEARSRPSSESGGASPILGYRATTKLVDAYPMKDGNPISVTNGKYTYDPVVFWVNRDPRFEATIAYNGSVWPLSGKTTRRQWTYNGAADETNIMGLYCKRFTKPGLAAGSVRYQNNLGGNGMDWIELRLAEVMLNLADCANETGDMNLAKDMVRQIRVRAGIEQGTAANDYGLGRVTSVSEMRDLILNERMVEFAFENKRNSDLRRTRRMHLLSGDLESIEFTVKDAAAKTALEAGSTTRFREGLNLNDKATYLQYFNPPARVKFTVSGVGALLPFSVPQEHYFYTFNDDFVNRGVNIQPTIGWAGGTFDPLAE